jgi:hypothetical protein
MATVTERIRGLSRASKTLIAGAVIIAVLGFTGFLRADNDVPVTSERAVEIATERLDFEPDRTAVRLVREGIDFHPVWAVSFSTSGSGEDLYDQVLVVSVDGQTGDIVRVSRE